MESLNKLKRDLNKHTDGKGNRVLIQLFCTYFLYCKAMARDWVLASMIPFYTEVLGADTAITDTMYTAARSPFGVKTLWGSLSDALPACGYHKRWYILWGATISTICVSAIIVLGWQYQNAEGYAGLGVVQLLTLLVFFFEYGGATVDSLTQARYTELMKKLGTPTIVSFVWFLMNSCSMISSLGNLLLQDGQWLVLLYLALPAALPMIYPAAMNFLQEEPADSFCSPKTEKVLKYGGIFAMSMVLAIGALGGTALLIFASDQVILRAVYFIVLSTVFVIMAYIFLPRNIASPAFYMFLCSSLRLFFSGTIQGFYTFPNTAGGLENCQKYHTLEDCMTLPCAQEGCTGSLVDDYICIPNGPGFATWYYQFFGNFIGAIAATIAVVIFEKVIVFWNVRAAFWVTTVFQMCSTCLEIIVFERYNFALFGMDPADESRRWVDQVFFLIGTQALDKIMEMLDFLPSNVLIGKLCPPNMEATIFAVLAGSQNFGTNIAFVFGAITVSNLGVRFQRGEKGVMNCTNPVPSFAPFGWKALTCARALGGIVLPIFTVPLTFLLLPNRALNDDFLEEENGPGGVVDEEQLAPAASLASIPKGFSGISASSFLSQTSATKVGVAGGKGQYL